MPINKSCPKCHKSFVPTKEQPACLYYMLRDSHGKTFPARCWCCNICRFKCRLNTDEPFMLPSDWAIADLKQKLEVELVAELVKAGAAPKPIGKSLKKLIKTMKGFGKK